jgi:hypothetical protein
MKAITTAAVLVAASAALPAFANDGRGYEPNRAIEFRNTAQTQRIVEGRNSDRTLTGADKVRAATSQGFAPIDTTNYGVNR